MSSAKTTADLFRERGWEVGTPVKRPESPCWWEALAIGRRSVFMRASDGREDAFEELTDWSLYRPVPPVPTEEEWRELWVKLEAWRNGAFLRSHCYQEPTASLLSAIENLNEKVRP